MHNAYDHNLAEHHKFLRHVQLLAWLIRGVVIVLGALVVFYFWP